MKGLEVLSEEEERGSGLMHTMVLSYVSLSHSHFYLTRNTHYLPNWLTSNIKKEPSVLNISKVNYFK